MMKLNARFVRAIFAGCVFVPAFCIDAQPAVPVRTLSAPDAVTLLPFGAIESVRPLNKGGVLVNDTHKRQLIALDSTFASFSVTLDSASQSGLSYGTRSQAVLIPYLADSVLFRDQASGRFFVIDPNGDIVHRLERTKPGQTPLALTAPRGFDALGNVIMPAIPQIPRGTSSDDEIVRVNYETRQYETMTQIFRAIAEHVQFFKDGKGAQQAKRTINPVQLADDWVVLSDGTLAVVRVREYGVDMIDPITKKKTSLKLPSDKRRYTDDDKRQLLDSAQKAVDAELGDPNSASSESLSMIAGVLALGMDSLQKVARKSDGAFKVSGTPPPMPLTTIEYVPLKDISDRMPPFRYGEAKPDLEGNVWIPTNNVSSPDKNETLYDVVTNRAQLLQRVRVPVGRVIAGFGRGGMIYLKSKKGDNQWTLERVRLMN